ncbi:expressed unknown protein [Seminavis robusta]|uniref:Uncharacterized protein n=1 Tax=Seminavis robusta TaxID=568900 RepID=A0A9N8EVD1_9STRA|nr:expressed unknown protein [Seminavis robusta]|eukprot:Sro1799_g298370.1 n/a (122) ;mRNA; r:10963-11423
MKVSMRLLLIVLVTLLGSALASYGSTREEIIANRERRKEHLQKLLEEARETKDNHVSGRKLLSEEELTAVDRKINAFERKMETMQGEMDEREIERVLQREQLRAERDEKRRRERRQRASEL